MSSAISKGDQLREPASQSKFGVIPLLPRPSIIRSLMRLNGNDLLNLLITWTIAKLRMEAQLNQVSYVKADGLFHADKLREEFRSLPKRSFIVKWLEEYSVGIYISYIMVLEGNLN